MAPKASKRSIHDEDAGQDPGTRAGRDSGKVELAFDEALESSIQHPIRAKTGFGNTMSPLPACQKVLKSQTASCALRDG